MHRSLGLRAGQILYEAPAPDTQPPQPKLQILKAPISLSPWGFRVSLSPIRVRGFPKALTVLGFRV